MKPHRRLAPPLWAALTETLVLTLTPALACHRPLTIADCEPGEGFGNGVGMPRDDQTLCKVRPWWKKAIDKVAGRQNA